MKWIWMALLGMVAVDCYTAEASDMPIHTDLSADSGAAAVAVAGTATVVVADSVGTPEIIPEKAPEKTPEKAVVPARPKPRQSVLYLGGGEGALWYHIGVLETLEKYRIPVDTVIGSSWGAWVGALWTSGWSPAAIAGLLQDSTWAGIGLESRLDRRYPDRSPDPGKVVHVAGPEAPPGVGAFVGKWNVGRGSDGAPAFTRTRDNSDSAMFRDAWTRFRIQETLWRESPGKTIPFRVVLCQETAETRTWSAERRTLESLPLPGNSHAGELCGLYPQIDPDSSSTLAMFSSPLPLRSAGLTGSPWRIQVLESQRAAFAQHSSQWVVMRPHSMASGSSPDPRTLRQAGADAVKARLGDFSSLASRLRDYKNAGRGIPGRFTFQPVYDGVDAVLQGHLTSYWPSDTGMAAPLAFYKALEADKAYDSLEMKLSSSGDVDVRVVTAPALSLGAGFAGSTYHGNNAAGWAQIDWIDQFSYALRVEGYYGQTIRGIRPSLRLGRLWSAQGDFFVQGELLDLNVLNSALIDEDLFTRLKDESRRSVSLGVEWPVGENTEMRAVTAMDNYRIGTGTIDYLNADGMDLQKSDVSSLWLYGEWKYANANHDRWFSEPGLYAWLRSGFRSVGVHAFGESSAPLYWSTEAEASKQVRPFAHGTFGLALAAGADLRRSSSGGFEYPQAMEIVPDQVTDPALDNRFRLRMPLSPWTEEWWTSSNTSHHYALVRANIGIPFRFAGLYLLGGYVRDFERNPWGNLGTDRFWLDPVARIHYQSLDLRLGMHRQVDSNQLKLLQEWATYQYYVQLGNFDF